MDRPLSAYLGYQNMPKVPGHPEAKRGGFGDKKTVRFLHCHSQDYSSFETYRRVEFQCTSAFLLLLCIPCVFLIFLSAARAYTDIMGSLQNTVPPFRLLVAGGSYAGLSFVVNLLDICNGRSPRMAHEPYSHHPDFTRIPVDITIVDERDGYCWFRRLSLFARIMTHLTFLRSPPHRLSTRTCLVRLCCQDLDQVPRHPCSAEAEHSLRPRQP